MSFQKLCERCWGTGTSPDFDADFYQPNCSWCKGIGMVKTDENGIEYKKEKSCSKFTTDDITMAALRSIENFKRKNKK